MEALNKEEKFYRTFLISVGLIIAVTVSGIFLGISIETRGLIYQSLLANARSYFETIVATRAWNSSYGGVYVEKKAGVQSNPYLENPDIETKDGRIYTLRNPAMMTREVAQFIGKDKDFSFHITSRKLMNPSNTPDRFEAAALESFETGRKEEFAVEKINGKTFFRYAGPLYVQAACLHCHAKQGYAVGDVRGGISILFNINAVSQRLHRNTLLIVLLAVTTVTLLITVFWYLSERLMRKLKQIRKRIEEMAITDELTGIFNRRHVMVRFREELERSKRQHKKCGCLMMDIDHFKAINDKHGHLAGDETLKEVANRVRSVIRKYDIFGRYGGEEFLVVMPDSTIQEAATLADRICLGISARPINGIDVTLSLGVTHYVDSDDAVDDLIRRADESLYEAKNAGRNCVKVSPAY